MWRYSITDGEITSADGSEFFRGYSGAGHTLDEGRNNPAMVGISNAGPIPPGQYSIGMPHLSAHTGRYTMNLDPLPGTNTFGRSLFRIHGNNETNSASHGCIILPPDARTAVWESGDHLLEVVVS